MTRALEFAKLLVAVAAIFALTAIGILGIQSARFMRDSRSQMSALAVHLEATITDVDRAAQIAGGAINAARDIERDNRKDIAAVNKQTVQTFTDLDALVKNIDVTQRQAGESIQSFSQSATTTMQFIPDVLTQTRQDLAALEPAIRQVTPLLQQSTAIAGNLNQGTADVAHEIHKLVYPPPRKWYQKYFLDPLRTAAHLITVPIR